MTDGKAGIPQVGSWIISASRGVSTLHVIGACYRVPGVNYKSWSVVSNLVEKGAYKKACKSCFPKGYPLIKENPEGNVENEMEVGMPRELADAETSNSDSSDSS